MSHKGTNGPDRIKGTEGSDRLKGKGGDDKIDGYGGRDVISGGDGDDIIDGGQQDDNLSGGDGSDILIGGYGSDYLNGGFGSDILRGGYGSDTLVGGGGNDGDQFNFVVNTTSLAGQDTILDFDETSEYINLGSYGSFSRLDTNGDGELTSADTWITLTGNTTRIDVGAAFGFAANTEVLTVTNVINSPLDSNDFLFL